MNKHTLLVVVRWLIAAGLFFMVFRVVGRLAQIENLAVTDLPKVLAGIGLAVGGVAFLAPELVYWASFPLQYAMNSIFFPGRIERPPPDYTLTRVYRDQERYQEAIEQYFRIIRYHPEELLAYIEGIETAFECQSPKIAQKFYRLGMRRFRSKETQQQIWRAFQQHSEAEQPREGEALEADANVDMEAGSGQPVLSQEETRPEPTER